MVKKKATLDDDRVIDIARDALAGIAREEHVGPSSASEKDGIHTVSFDSTMPAYPGWNWVVTLTDGEGGDLSVLEVNLLPGEHALLAPDWVPWADRLEEYQRQEAERAEHSDEEDDDDHDDIDIDEDLDGIDIDQLDLDPSDLEVPDEPNDVFDHVDVDDD
jgi:hypothetical protein